jgi:hypothetical protein
VFVIGFVAQEIASYIIFIKMRFTMLGGFLVTTAWRVLRLRMEGSPPSTEGSYQYIE